MKIETKQQFNGVTLSLYVNGNVDGSPEQYDIELNSIVAKLGGTEVFRLEDGNESGLCKHSDLSDLIIKQSLTLLVNEKFTKYADVI